MFPSVENFRFAPLLKAHPLELPRFPFSGHLLEAHRRLQKEKAKETLEFYRRSMTYYGIPGVRIVEKVETDMSAISLFLIWGSNCSGDVSLGDPLSLTRNQTIAIVADHSEIYLNSYGDGRWDYFTSVRRYQRYMEDPSQTPPDGLIKGSIADQVRLALEPVIAPRRESLHRDLRHYLDYTADGFVR